MHNLKQTYGSVCLEDSEDSQGRGETSFPGRSTLRAQIEIGISRNNYEMWNISGC